METWGNILFHFPDWYIHLFSWYQGLFTHDSMAVYTKIVNFEMHESITEGGTFIQGLAGFFILQIGGWPPFAVWSQQLSAQGWCLFAGGCRDKTSFTHLSQITIRSYRYQWGRNYSILFTCHSNHAYKRKLKKNVFKLSQKLSYPLGIKYEVKICLLILSIYLCFRHYLYEKKIARLRWKLEYKDLMFVDNVEEIISPTKRKVNASLKPICKNFSNSCLFYIREIFHEPLKFLPGRSCPSILYILSQGYRRSADGWSDKILL